MEKLDGNAAQCSKFQCVVPITTEDPSDIFYVHGSAHRWSVLITVQRDATQSSLFTILQVHSTCFWWQTHLLSGVRKTVTTASGTGHIFLCSYLPPTWLGLATLEGGRCKVPEAVVTVLCTPDDVCGWHSKHVEWTCRIINRLLCVASRWTIINIYHQTYLSWHDFYRNSKSRNVRFSLSCVWGFRWFAAWFCVTGCKFTMLQNTKFHRIFGKHSLKYTASRPKHLNPDIRPR